MLVLAQLQGNPKAKTGFVFVALFCFFSVF